MNQENLKFLQDRLFYLGTEKKLYPELEKNMAEGKPEFQLAFSNHYEKDKLTASLQFRKSDTGDMYFLNRYQATLQKPAQESKSQLFYLDNGKGVTMKEAYNLLEGRSVNKDLKTRDGVKYNAWLKLDFDNKDANGNAKLLQYHKNYGYDLNQELARLPIFPMQPDDLKQLVSSLERGNVQEVRLHEIEGRPSVWLAANPQFKTINLFDQDMKPLGKDEKQALHILAEYQKSESYEMDQHSGNKVSQTASGQATEKTIAPAKEESKDESKEKSKQQTKPESGQTKETGQKKTKGTAKEKTVESLLPKKRSGHAKGMSI